ncbi:MAG: galactose mutarotase [Verrucomicrobiae bacterium]|nr:galactose mutarotase [Verrucomicrobiae bacterium]
MQFSRALFGYMEDKPVDLHTLENDNGMVVKITNYGGTVTDIIVPDKYGNAGSIACGFNNLDGYFDEAYRANSPYFGCIVGRYAGRVKDGRFRIGGQTYQLATNDEPNHIHGGIRGFDKCLWNADPVESGEDFVALKLSLLSPEGDEGYPGNLNVEIEYILNNDNELRICYRALTDRATPLALTNHTYFNLNGFIGNVLDHEVQIFSDRYLEPDETNVPVGDETAVAGTVADFNKPKRVGDCFEELPMGFEHFYVYSKPLGKLDKVAVIREPVSGRTLEVSTSEPGGLFYTGRYTSDALCREDGTQFGQFRGFCVETAKYPNGPNIEGAPKSLLEPGQTYDETTVYKLNW